jgi:hypothetical protein
MLHIIAINLHKASLYIKRCDLHAFYMHIYSTQIAMLYLKKIKLKKNL